MWLGRKRAAVGRCVLAMTFSGQTDVGQTDMAVLNAFTHFCAMFCALVGDKSCKFHRLLCGVQRDTQPSKWRLCVLSLYACSAFYVGFIHDLVFRRKLFSVQSRDTVFILAETLSAMSDELRHKTAVNVSIYSQSSSKKSAMKTV